MGSMTDFQSAKDHEEPALVATPLIKNVGVPTTPKDYSMISFRFRNYFHLFLPREQAYFHEIRVSSFKSSLAIPDANCDFDTIPA